MNFLLFSFLLEVGPRDLSSHDNIIVITTEQEGTAVLSKDEEIRQMTDVEVVG